MRVNRRSIKYEGDRICRSCGKGLHTDEGLEKHNRRVHE